MTDTHRFLERFAAQLYLTYFAERLGTRVAPSRSLWSPGATAAGSVPRSVTDGRLAASNETRAALN
jgi:hypothetical protein